MTVETTDRKENFAGGQGSLTYAFRSLVDHPEYIKVLTVSSGTETLLTYLTAYTVAPSADGVGGIVTVSPSFGTEYTYTVYRETAETQGTDYDDYNQFPADTVEDDFDRRSLIDQEYKEDLGRALTLPVSSTISTLTLPAPVEARALVWSGPTIINSEFNPDSSVSSASTSAILAGNYATSASTSATESANSATSASTSAVAAANSATTASTAALTIPDPAGQTVADQIRINAGQDAYELFTPSPSAEINDLEVVMTGVAEGEVPFGASAGVGVYAGGTAKIKVGTFTRDVSITTSTQAITGVGFKPSYVTFLAIVPGNGSLSSWGTSDGVTDKGINLDASATSQNINNVIWLELTGSDTNDAVINSLDSDGFTLGWTKFGSPTGTAQIQFTAHR